MPKRTVIQTGDVCGDLFVYCHIEGSYIADRVKQTTSDAFVSELQGAGTSAYKGLFASHGGWGSYVNELASQVGHPFHRTTLITWSAGSQCALEAAASDDLPDAIVMMDGLYGSKPSRSKMGDGLVVWTPELEALAKYALKAARGEKIFVLFHSGIPTPYASSKECAEAVKAWVEKQMVTPMQPEDISSSDLDNHPFEKALVLGNFHFVSFKGQDAKEHILEAHLWDEACKLWVPWVASANTCEGAETASPPAPISYPNRRDLRRVQPALRGKDVEEWQKFLVTQGADLKVDGVFGPQTESKTVWFQTAYNLPKTGIVDQGTFDAALSAGMRPNALTVKSAPVLDETGPTTLSAATLAQARKDLAAGVWEDKGTNDGVRIRVMLAKVGVTWPTQWCAAASSTWMLEGAQLLGQSAPVPGSAGAKAFMVQFQSAKRFYSQADLLKDPTLLKPGMIVFWDRSTPGDPRTRWMGHVGVCDTPEATGDFTTVEGNSGPDARRVFGGHRKISDPRFLGAGWLD